MRHQSARRINDRWRFHLGDVSVESASACSWTSVTLPHSWNALDEMEIEEVRHYRRAIGWYMREIESPPPGQRLWVAFEAASQRASAWLNGRQIGSHAGGYTGFTVELIPDQRQEILTLALRVDNLPDPDLIPSDLSDFFLSGGLTRNVWCYTSGPCRIATLYCKTEVSADAATVTIRGQLDSPPPYALQLVAHLFSPDGTLLARLEQSITDAAFVFPATALLSPELWSPGNPLLYTVRLELRESQTVWDTVTERFGLRFLAFPAGGPFLLNGEPLLLYGTHRHEDWAGYASAVPDELSCQELRQIKAAGLNFVRLGHYPQAPAVLDACDELGLLVWEELPWCRGGIGGERFQAQTLAMLAEMIEQDYNHPAIVMWGLGNELDWESDHPDSTDEQVALFLHFLHEFAHAHDPQRLTALRRFEPGASIVDVYSPSIWSGWYRGRYEDYEVALIEALARYPRMLHIEWGGDSHAGRHSAGRHLATEIVQESDHGERPGIAISTAGPPRGSRDSDWSESYMLDLMEWHLQVQLRTPQLAGSAQWAFKDFATPLRPENPIPYVNQKGLVDRAGQPRDLYYLFQSYLTLEPMCHIESPTWTIRTGEAIELQRVRVYSNCSRVNLFVNGEMYGERQRDGTAFPAAGLVWQVLFRPGQNEVRAVGMSLTGTCVEQVITLDYCQAALGAGVAFQWQSEPGLTIDGQEKGTAITLQLVDADGHPVVADRRRVSFSLQGSGALCDNLGVAGGSRVIELANGRASIVVLEAEITTLLVVTAEGLQQTSIPLFSNSQTT
jgi:beta-galactosidase